MAEAMKKVNGNGAAKELVARLGGGRWKTRESAKNHFVYLVEDEATTEDLKRPGFFDLVAGQLRRRDDIEVHSMNGRKRWMFQVLDAGLGWAQVHLLQEWDLPAVTETDRDVLEGFELLKDPVTSSFYAVRKRDRQTMFRQEGLRTKLDLITRIQRDATVRQAK